MAGFTCCVPGCNNNSTRHKGVGLHSFPKDRRLRDEWISKVRRAGNTGRFSKFVPTSGHKACGAHFEGGRKTYMTRVPTVFAHAQPRKKPERRRLVRHPSPQAAQSTGGASADLAHDLSCSDLPMDEPDCSTRSPAAVVQLEHGYALHSMEDQKRLIFDQRDQLLSMQAELEAARTFADNMERAKREVEVKLLEELRKTQRSNEKLKSQLNFMKEQQASFKEQLKGRSCELTYEALLQDPKKLKYYTGFATPDLFKGFLSFLKPHIERLQFWRTKCATTDRGRRFALPTEDQFTLIMVRLRLGLDGTDLAYRFGVSKSTVSRVWITWLDFLYNRLLQIPIAMSPALCDKYRPQAFKEKGYTTVDGILDCREVFIETPSCFRVQGETYSRYKKHNTAKGLVMWSPNGLVTYVSDLAPGRLSDKELTVKSKVLDSVSPGRSVMADRGFIIEEDCRKRFIELNIPPFMKGKTQLSVEEEQATRRIASIRIHIERVIRRIKTFKILSSVFPNSMAWQLNKVWHVCARITNFVEKPLLDKETQPL